MFLFPKYIYISLDWFSTTMEFLRGPLSIYSNGNVYYAAGSIYMDRAMYQNAPYCEPGTFQFE